MVNFGLLVIASLLNPKLWAFTTEELSQKYTQQQEILAKYLEAAKKAGEPGGFAAPAGQAFYAEEHQVEGKKLSCASCHRQDPSQPGKSEAGKELKPMAISANPARFLDLKKTEKWFRRNCADVLQRSCTFIEKGNFIKFLLEYKSKL